jgi:hypothetical protein
MGMDSTSPLQLVQPGFARTAYNCRPGLNGGVVKRGGFDNQLSSAWGTRKITGGWEFRVAGTARTLLFGTDGQAAGGTLAYNNGGSASSIKASLSGTARPSGVSVNDLFFLFNGTDAPVVYDGTNERQMGITAPTNAATVSMTTGGSLNQNANYLWTYTYYNSTTGAESSPAPLSASTATGTNTQADLTLTAGSATTADTIRIYRTNANGQVFFLDGTNAINDTSYSSTIADSALGDELELDNSRVTLFDSAPDYPQVCDNRMFVRTDVNEIRYSKVGQSGPMPESFQAHAFVPTLGVQGNSDRIVGIAKAGSTPIVLKERSIGALRKRGIQDLTLATDSVYFDYEELSADHGATSHWGATEVYGECIYLGKDNIYGTRGAVGDIRPLADPIAATIRSLGLSSSQVTQISAANNPKHKYVAFAVCGTSAASTPNYVIVGDYQLYPRFRWTLYVPGTNASTHPGIRAGSLFVLTNSSDGTQDLYFGNANGDGQFSKMETGDIDEDKAIYFELITRPYDVGTVVQNKLWNRVILSALGDGNDYDLSVASIYDQSESEESADTLSLDPGGAQWDQVNWDEFNWATNSIPPVRYDLHRKSIFYQLVVRQTEANAPVTMYDWQIVANRFRPF